MDNIYKGEWNAITKISLLELIILAIMLVGMLFIGYQISRGMGNPLEQVTLSIGWRWIVLAILLVFGRVFLPFMGSGILKTEISPYKIVSYEMAKNTKGVKDIFTAWGESGKSTARKEIKIDFAFIFYYTLALCFICFWIADWQKGTWSSAVWLALGWSMPIAGLLDVIENIALLQMLGDKGANSLLAGIAFWSALPKSIITTVLPLIVVLMMLAGVFLKAIRPQP